MSMKNKASMVHRLAGAAAFLALAASFGAHAQDVGVTPTEILIGEVQPMSGRPR